MLELKLDMRNKNSYKKKNFDNLKAFSLTSSWFEAGDILNCLAVQYWNSAMEPKVIALPPYKANNYWCYG